MEVGGGPGALTVCAPRDLVRGAGDYRPERAAGEPIGYLPVSPVASWLLDKKRTFRLTAWCACVLHRLRTFSALPLDKLGTRGVHYRYGRVSAHPHHLRKPCGRAGLSRFPRECSTTSRGLQHISAEGLYLGHGRKIGPIGGKRARRAAGTPTLPGGLPLPPPPARPDRGTQQYDVVF